MFLKKRNETKIRDSYTRHMGYNLVVMKECEWNKVSYVKFVFAIHMCLMRLLYSTTCFNLQSV